MDVALTQHKQTDRRTNEKKPTNFAWSNFVAAAFIWLGKCTGFVAIFLFRLLFD